MLVSLPYAVGVGDTHSSPPLRRYGRTCQWVAPEGLGAQGSYIFPPRGGAGAVDPPRTSIREGCRGAPDPAFPSRPRRAGRRRERQCARYANQAREAVQIVAEVRGLTTVITQICAGHPAGRSRMAVIRHRAVSLNERELAIAGEGGGFSVPAADLDHDLHNLQNCFLG